MIQKREHPKEKSNLHPRNKNRERYDFKQLIESTPELEPFVKLNLYGDESVDFASPEAVMLLNKAILKHHYRIDNWEVPKGYLCPPIPGRADYIHHIADFLCRNNYWKNTDRRTNQVLRHWCRRQLYLSDHRSSGIRMVVCGIGY